MESSELDPAAPASTEAHETVSYIKVLLYSILALVGGGLLLGIAASGLEAMNVADMDDLLASSGVAGIIASLLTAVFVGWLWHIMLSRAVQARETILVTLGIWVANLIGAVLLGNDETIMLVLSSVIVIAAWLYGCKIISRRELAK